MPQYYEATQTPPPAEWVAPPVGQAAILGGLEGLASGVANYGAMKKQQRVDERKAELGKALLRGLVEQGVKAETAKAVVLQWMQDPDAAMVMLDKIKDIQTTAADIKAKDAKSAGDLAAAGETTEATKWIGPKAEADIAGTQAEAGLKAAQATAVPIEAAAKSTVANTGQTAEANRHSEFAQTFGLETEKFVSTFDRDKSGTIDPEEEKKLLRANRAAVRKEVYKANLPENQNKFDSETRRFKSMTDADIDAEALSRTAGEIDDFEFSNKNVGTVVRGAGRKPYGGGVTSPGPSPSPAPSPLPDNQLDTKADTYEEAVQKINAQIFDPVRKQAALAAAKAYFGVR